MPYLYPFPSPPPPGSQVGSLFGPGGKPPPGAVQPPLLQISPELQLAAVLHGLKQRVKPRAETSMHSSGPLHRPPGQHSWFSAPQFGEGDIVPTTGTHPQLPDPPLHDVKGELLQDSVNPEGQEEVTTQKFAGFLAQVQVGDPHRVSVTKHEVSKYSVPLQHVSPGPIQLPSDIQAWAETELMYGTKVRKE